MTTLHVLSPSYKSYGGILKIMDYVTHALAAGYEVAVRSQWEWDPTLPLFNIERFAPLGADERVTFHSSRRLTLTGDDLVFFSLPTDYELAYASLPGGMSAARVIHIVQGIRHVTPTWANGYPARLLTRPASRISVNQAIADVIAPHLDPRGLHRVINLGHDHGYFLKERSGGFEPGRPLRVAYTTWKSDVGDRTAALLAAEHREDLEFRAIRDAVDWAELRDLYHWADIFLSTPEREEGFYMPGLEAMESGCIVVTPDAGGNMSYCRPDDNCFLVDHDSEGDYARAVRELMAAPAERIAELRAHGYTAIENFDLERERRGFADFLATVQDRVEELENA